MINRVNGNPLGSGPKKIRIEKNENLENMKTITSVRIAVTRDTISPSFVENNFSTSPPVTLPRHDPHPRARLIAEPQKREKMKDRSDLIKDPKGLRRTKCGEACDVSRKNTTLCGWKWSSSRTSS